MGKLWIQPNKNVRGQKNPNWKGGKIKLICKSCHKKYFKFPSQMKNNRSKFCSKKCFYNRHPHIAVKDGRGYMWIYKPDHKNSTPTGYIREHRYVMEQKLGRLLKKSEVVHHINGIKADNRPENLKVFIQHSEHMKYHHSV